MQYARIRREGTALLVFTPYDPALVREFNGVPGSRWKPDRRAWSFPTGSEQQVREIVRQCYPIEDEGIQVAYETLRVHITGSDRASVSINGVDLFSSASGYLDMRPNYHFEILDYAGGFTSREGRSFTVDYTLRLKVRTDATWQTRGYGAWQSTCTVLSGNNPIDQFLESLVERME